MSNEIQVGDKLDMQRGTLVYVGDGKADAYVDGVLKQAGVVLTAAQIAGWHQVKAKQAAYCGTRTSATL